MFSNGMYFFLLGNCVYFISLCLIRHTDLNKITAINVVGSVKRLIINDKSVHIVRSIDIPEVVFSLCRVVMSAICFVNNCHSEELFS